MDARRFCSITMLIGFMAMTPSPAGATEAAGAPSDGGTAAATELPIRTRSQLDAWLRDHAGRPTPLDRMGAGARTRFLASLVFGANGLGGFGTDDLGATLTREEIRAVLALFGPEIEAYAEHIPSPRLPGDRNPPPSTTSSIDQRFTQLFLLEQELGDLADAARGDALVSRYHALFPEAGGRAGVQAASAADLKLLFRAASLATFYAPDAAAAMAMSVAADEMDARGIASIAELDQVRNNLLAARRFASALGFTERHAQAGLASLPAFVGADLDFGGQPTLWRLDQDRPVLERRPVDLEPLQVLVLAGCHFSADAARDIDADPVLGPVFRKHARWLSLPPGREDPDAVRTWNREHPHAPMEMLYDRTDWPMFTRWAMPTFYVVRNGKVIGTMAGWSPNSAAELDALLRRTGLL